MEVEAIGLRFPEVFATNPHLPPAAAPYLYGARKQPSTAPVAHTDRHAYSDVLYVVENDAVPLVLVVTVPVCKTKRSVNALIIGATSVLTSDVTADLNTLGVITLLLVDVPVVASLCVISAVTPTESAPIFVVSVPLSIARYVEDETEPLKVFNACIFMPCLPYWSLFSLI